MTEEERIAQIRDRARGVVLDLPVNAQMDIEFLLDTLAARDAECEALRGLLGDLCVAYRIAIGQAPGYSEDIYGHPLDHRLLAAEKALAKGGGKK